MNALTKNFLISACLGLLIFAVFALSTSALSTNAQSPTEGDEFFYLPIIQVEEEIIGGTVPTRTPTP